MAEWLKSSQIKVYPCAYRGAGTFQGAKRSYNPESRLSIEENTISLVQRILHKEFFVISGSSSSDPITLSIKGYLVKIEAGALPSGGKVYATIQIGPRNKPTSGEEPFDYENNTLINQNETSNTNLDISETSGDFFYGVRFTTEPQKGDEEHKMYSYLLLEDGKVPEYNKFRLTTEDIENITNSESGQSIKEKINTNDIEVENTVKADLVSSEKLFSEKMVERDGSDLSKGLSEKSEGITNVSPMIINEGRYKDSNIKFKVEDKSEKERLSIGTRSGLTDEFEIKDVEVKYADKAVSSDNVNKGKGLIYNTNANNTSVIANGDANSVLTVDSEGKPSWKDPSVNLTANLATQSNYLKKGSTNEYYSIDFDLVGTTLTIKYTKKQ